MASKGQIRLKSAWRPTSLIGVINGREDLSDIEKVTFSLSSNSFLLNLTNYLSKTGSIDIYKYLGNVSTASHISYVFYD